MTDRFTPLWTVHCAGTVAVIAVVGLFWYATWEPLSSDIASHRERTAQLQHLLAQRTEALRTNQQLRLELAELEALRETAHQRIPAQESAAEFLGTWQQIAHHAELTLIDVARDPVQSGEQVSTFQVHCRCRGSYDSICRALFELYQLPRLVNVAQFQLDGASGDGDYPCSLTFELYFGGPRYDTEKRGVL